jgi:hypothetical protein
MATKTCSCCAEVKPVAEFGKNRQKKDGLHVYCKTCSADKQRSWRTENKDSANAIALRYRQNHPETQKEINRRFRTKHREKRNAYAKKYFKENREYFRMWDEQNKESRRNSSKKYRAENPDKQRAAEARRRASVLQALPEWDEELTQFVTEEAFDLAKRRKEITGFAWHVDHVVPLKGKNVCGLHVWNNFQVIPATENLKKGNKWQT